MTLEPSSVAADEASADADSAGAADSDAAAVADAAAEVAADEVSDDELELQPASAIADTAMTAAASFRLVFNVPPSQCGPPNGGARCGSP